MKTIHQILNRYAESNSSRYQRKIWEELEKRWTFACLETFVQLPPPPTVFSASQYAKANSCSHVTAKKYLIFNPEFVQLSPKLFVTKNTQYLPFIVKSPSPQGFVRGVEKLRELPEGFIPTTKNLKKHLGIRCFNNIRVLLGFAKLFTNSNGKHLCFIPTFILSQLHSTPSKNEGERNGGV